VTSAIDRMLIAARSRLSRLDPGQAAKEQAAGALIVDIRPDAQRRAEGEIPGSLVLERNVLEWRLDPTSTARIPAASDALRVIVACSQGYTSSLAAASLQDLGLDAATDIVGGFLAWQAIGLPTAPGGTPAGEYVHGRPPRS
jgi:rhodanese-related sulfurtransferase